MEVFRQITLHPTKDIYEAISGLQEKCLQLNPNETTSIGEFTLKLVSLGGAIMEKAIMQQMKRYGKSLIVGPSGEEVYIGSSQTGDSSPPVVSGIIGDSGPEIEGAHPINPS